MNPGPSRPLPPLSPIVFIKSAGEMASGIAWRLYQAHIRRLVMIDLPAPLAVRRRVSFCEALLDGQKRVEGVVAVPCHDRAGIEAAWAQETIAVIPYPDRERLGDLVPDVVVDAILAKRNLGTSRDEAGLVIGLGPGFEAGHDVDLVVETHRGHDLGRVLQSGSALANTGIPGAMAGVTHQRVLRAPATGRFETDREIGAAVQAGEAIGRIAGIPVVAQVGGILRGLIRPGVEVREGVKIGDIDPRGEVAYCDTISDKARALGGAVLEALLRHANRPI